MVFSKVTNSFKDFNELYTITPLFDVDDYAKEAKFRVALLLDINKIKQKNNYHKAKFHYNFKFVYNDISVALCFLVPCKIYDIFCNR